LGDVAKEEIAMKIIISNLSFCAKHAAEPAPQNGGLTLHTILCREDPAETEIALFELMFLECHNVLD